jgi:NAD+ kinase
MKILHDTENPKAVRLFNTLRRHLSARDGGEHLNLVLGGDGFMLHAIRNHYHPDVAFLGLNCGSIGFLLNEVPREPKALVPMIRERQFGIRKFPRIQMKVRDLDGRTHRAAAINDIYLERMTGQSCHLRLDVDGITMVEKMVCDGIIVSTALGSTAYNVSASGPVCHPSLEIVCVTPICPHSPRLSPVVLSLSSTISMDVLHPERRLAQAVADGVVFPNVVEMTVTPSRGKVSLAFLDGHDYTSAMIHKVLRV